MSIEGTPLTAKVLYAANHFSWLDVLVLGGAAPVIVVARGDVEGWPVVGWAAKLNDTIFIARDRRSVKGQADTLRQALGTAAPSRSSRRARPRGDTACSPSARACSPRFSRRFRA